MYLIWQGYDLGTARTHKTDNRSTSLLSSWKMRKNSWSAQILLQNENFLKEVVLITKTIMYSRKKWFSRHLFSFLDVQMQSKMYKTNWNFSVAVVWVWSVDTQLHNHVTKHIVAFILPFLIFLFDESEQFLHLEWWIINSFKIQVLF